jgi:hypothetical protein
MNVFKVLSLLTGIFLTTTLFANEPQLFLYNNHDSQLKIAQSENLQKLEINNDELIILHSFSLMGKIKKNHAAK